MTLLSDPTGTVAFHPEDNLVFYASCVFQDIRENQGDVASWWLDTQQEYGGVVIDDVHYTTKPGAPHFWKRVDEREELVPVDSQQNVVVNGVGHTSVVSVSSNDMIIDSVMSEALDDPVVGLGESIGIGDAMDI